MIPEAEAIKSPRRPGSARAQDGAVITEFPSDLLPLLRCITDGGPLSIDPVSRRGSFGVIEARMRCTCCKLEYRIENGIARMLLHHELTAEDRHEVSIRDVEYACPQPPAFAPPASGWRSELNDLIEIPPFLAALAPLDGQRVLEIGCGDGRFTILMAQLGAHILAVDFSINALRKMAHWLSAGVAPTAFRIGGTRPDFNPGRRIGLVQADASRFRAAPRGFDRALSATPLDSREQRMAMYRTIADGLTDDGRYVGSFEHDDLTRRLLGLPPVRRYRRGGIFIEHFDTATVRRESAPFFMKRRIRPIRPKIPLLSRLPKSVGIALARAVEHAPLLKNFGEILLLTAEEPQRPRVEGVKRTGSRLVRAAFRWYTAKLGKQPLWGTDEIVP